MWKSYEQFASSTELHGFDQVIRYNKFWGAVWLCLTVAACGFCINDVANLAITYQAEPTIMDLILTPNWDLGPPNPTLCMEVNVDSHQMVTFLFENMTYPTTDIDSDLQDFLTATENAENLNISYRDQLNLTENLQYFTYVMLSYITEAETSYIGYSNSALTSFVTEFSMAADNGQMVNATVGYLYKRYLDRNVSFANLKRLIGMSICQQRTDILTRTNATHSINSTICNPHMITHLSFSMVCSKLLDDNIEELADYNIVTLNGTRVSQIEGMTTDNYFGQQNGPGPFSSIEVTFAWHLDFQGRPMLPVGSRQDVFSWNAYQGRAFSLTVAAEYNFHNTKRNPCQSVQWQYDCEFNRRVKLMENNCGCRPSTLIYGVIDATLPKCSENPLKPVWILTDNETNSNFTGICGLQGVDDLTKNNCVRDCQLFTFDIEYAQPSLRLKAGMSPSTSAGPQNFRLPTGVVEFTLNMGKSRQLVKESAAKTFSTFICDFGGSIGAWLGASLLSFAHAAIHIVCTCYDAGKYLKERKKKNIAAIEKTKPLESTPQPTVIN